MNLATGYLGTAVTHPEQVRMLARKIFDNYDKDRKGFLGETEVANIMIDLYRSFNLSCTPSKSEIGNYSSILDFDNDRRVSRVDLENVIKKFLMVDLEFKRDPFVKNKTSEDFHQTPTSKNHTERKTPP
jgi:hypothetical protein